MKIQFTAISINLKMENCTIYSHHLEFDKVVDIVKTKLPKAKVEFNDGGLQKSLIATIKGGFFGKTKTLKINYRERKNPSYKLDTVECGLTQNLSGMVNFIQSLPAQNETVKGKFLYKVSAANSEMPFIAEPNINDDFKAVLEEIVQMIDGFIFAQPNAVFTKSSGQHFVDKDFALILDTNGISELSDMDVRVDAKYHDEPKDEYNEEQRSRKLRSQRILNENGIKVNTNLPCLISSDNMTLRDRNDVIDRAYALMVIAAKGEGVTREQLKRPIEEKNIDKFTPREDEILNTEVLTDHQKSYATWRYESLYTMLWALGYAKELKYPSDICDVQDIVGTILKPSRDDFSQNCTLRSKNEILDELDKIYRMNWACVDARMHGQTVGGGINPSVIYERHYSLNWLVRYQDQEWDDVQTNT